MEVINVPIKCIGCDRVNKMIDTVNTLGYGIQLSGIPGLKYECTYDDLSCATANIVTSIVSER